MSTSTAQVGVIVGVVGATGAIGREIVQILEERQFPISRLRLFASEKSLGDLLEYRGKEITVDVFHPSQIEECQFLFFAAGEAISREHAPVAAHRGALVIDCSSAFREDSRVPLVVPEVNGKALRDVLEARQGKGIIVSSPSSAVIPLVIALNPLLEAAGLKRVVVSTYQAVSAIGQKGVMELSGQVTALFSGGELETENFSQQVAFNCIPHIGDFLPDGSTREEADIVAQSRRILGAEQLRMAVTAVTVPTFSCFGESVNVEFDRELTPDAARELLRSSPGILVTDDTTEGVYPVPADLVGTDATYVGRIRKDDSVSHGLQLWIVADNVRKGAALNAVELAEIMFSTNGRAH